MTKEDFIFIAKTIRETEAFSVIPDDDACLGQEQVRRLVAESFADALAQTNSTFHRETFLSACGVK